MRRQKTLLPRQAIEERSRDLTARVPTVFNRVLQIRKRVTLTPRVAMLVLGKQRDVIHFGYDRTLSLSRHSAFCKETRMLLSTTL
jgi:hypothetical protein